MKHRTLLVVPIVIFCPLSFLWADVSDVVAMQTEYGSGFATVLVTWTETGGNPQGVRVRRDGVILEDLDGASTDGTRSIALENQLLGEHVYRVEGQNGSFGEQVQTVLFSHPFGDPQDLRCAKNSLNCTLSGKKDACEIIIEWDNDGPFSSNAIYSVFVDGKLRLEAPTEGTYCAAVLADSPGEQEVTIYAEASAGVDGAPGRYRSSIARATCSFDCPLTGSSFTRGVCNGVGGVPTLTGAIFGLNHLFIGRDAPPCREACDADGDGRFILTDMIYVLNFLFLGGDPPDGWVDETTGESRGPRCEIAPVEMCVTAHDAC